MYTKLNLHLPELDISRLKGTKLQSYGNPETKTTNYLIKDLEYFYSLHPGRLRFGIRPDYAYYITVAGTDMLWPHIDPDTSCALNYYINPADATTSFYQEKPQLQYFTQQDYDVPDLKHLVVKGSNDLDNFDLIGSFRPEAYSCYLMRVDIWHSVSRPNGLRTMLSWRWNTASYSDVLDSIHIL